MLKVPRSTFKDVHHRRAATGTTAQTGNAVTGATGGTAGGLTGDGTTPANGNANANAVNGAAAGTGTGTGTGAGTGTDTGNAGNAAAGGDTTTDNTTSAVGTTDTTTAAAAAAVTSTSAAVIANASASSTTAKATTKVSISSSAPSTTSTPTVVVVTSTTPGPIAASTPVSSSVVAPTTMTGVAKAATTAAADPYGTVTGTQMTRTYMTSNWLSSNAAAATAAVGGATSGPSAGGIVGIVAGCLLALVSLGAAVGYFFRRQMRKKRRAARFNRSKFVRQSVALPDNDFNEKPQMGTKNALALARANNGGILGADAAEAGPRPPSMVERRIQAAPVPGQVVVNVNGEQHDQNGNYPNDDGHQQYNYNHGPQQGQYDYNYGHQQGQYDQYAAGGHQQGQYDQYGAGNQQYDQYATGDQQQTNLTRQPSMTPSVASNYPDVQDEYYQDDGHASVTPYQQEQYAEINRQLNTTGDHLAVPNAGNGNASVSRSLSTTYSSLNPQKPSKTYNEHSEGDRSGTPTDRNPQQTYFQPSENSPTPTSQYAAGVAGRHRAAPTRAAHRSIDDDENAD